MRVWRYQGVHRLAWVVIALLVLAVAVFAMAAGFRQLRNRAVPEAVLPGDQGRLPPAALELASSWMMDGVPSEAPHSDAPRKSPTSSRVSLDRLPRAPARPDHHGQEHPLQADRGEGCRLPS